MSQDRALQLVLDLRKKQEQEALEHYSAVMQKVNYFKDQIQKVREFKQNYIDELNNLGQKGFAANVYLSYQNFLDKLDNIIEKQSKELSLLEQQAKAKQLEYFEKQKQRKIIESLLEKHRLNRIALENKREQKLLDEFVTSQFTRRSQ